MIDISQGEGRLLSPLWDLPVYLISLASFLKFEVSSGVSRSYQHLLVSVSLLVLVHEVILREAVDIIIGPTSTTMIKKMIIQQHCPKVKVTMIVSVVITFVAAVHPNKIFVSV